MLNTEPSEPLSAHASKSPDIPGRFKPSQAVPRYISEFARSCDTAVTTSASKPSVASSCVLFAGRFLPSFDSA
jgi:hypothetical protein